MSDATEFVPLCKISDIPPGKGRQFRPDSGRWRLKPMAVFNDGQKFHVTNYVCPHMGGPMSESAVEGGFIECPWHAWRFNVETGHSDQDDGDQISVYECRVDGDTLMVAGIKRG
jgi:nitrite reductase (NADH) small subunit